VLIKVFRYCLKICYSSKYPILFPQCKHAPLLVACNLYAFSIPSDVLSTKTQMSLRMKGNNYEFIVSYLFAAHYIVTLSQTLVQ